jgi:hypothetical protein
MYITHNSESAGSTARLYVSEQFDSDGEVSIQLTGDETTSGYFTRANLVELRDHLDYLLNGRRPNAEPRVITESLIREFARDEAKNVVREYHNRVANVDV